MSSQAQGLLCHYLSEDMSGINLGNLELPKIEKDLVKIKISHASLNFPDWLMSQGKYQRKPELPFFLGMEGSGTIESIGPDVKDLKIDDEVMLADGVMVQWQISLFCLHLKYQKNLML